MDSIPAPQESLSPRLVRLAVGGAALLSALNLVGTAFSPWLLLEHPLLLVALSAEVRHLILAAGRVDLGEVVVIGALRRVLSMLGTYGLAAVYGFAALRWLEGRYPRVGAFARALERLFVRRGVLLLVIFPSYTLSAVAGAARSPWRPFLLATLLGQTLVTAAYVFLGEAITTWTAPILGWLKDHMVESTVVCVVAVLAQQLWSSVRKRRQTGP